MPTVTIAYVMAHVYRLTHRPDGTDHDLDTRRLRGDVGAVSTEMVILIAGLAALALAVVAIIAAKVNDKANNIPMG